MGEAVVAANPVANFLADALIIPLAVILLLNLLQRRGRADAKRKGTLALAGCVLILLCASFLLVRFALPDALLLPVLTALVLIGLRYRKAIFPFPLRCSVCGRFLGLKHILLYAEPRCAACEAQSNAASQRES
jgi:hypothetical protein